MDSFISLDKCQFNVLEIKTLDKSIYVPREWLASISHYFKSLLTNGCKESNADSCFLNYESKFLLILFDIINSFHRGSNYLCTQFNKLTTVEDIYNFASLLTEYQLDQILELFDSCLANNRELKSIMTSHLINTVCLFNLKKTRTHLRNTLSLKNYIDIIKLLDYTNISFEFVELFFECGINIHFKIFGKWASVHQPTDTLLMESNLIKHDLTHFVDMTPRAKYKILNIVFNLKNANNFKIVFYEKILHFIHDKCRKKHPPMQMKDNKYKTFIKSEIENNKLNDIDYITLVIQINDKWFKPITFDQIPGFPHKPTDRNSPPDGNPNYGAHDMEDDYY